MPNTQPDNKFLVLFATTTDEKITQYNAVARLNRHNMVFVNFKAVMDFHSSDEEKGDRQAHAEDKFQEIEGCAALLKKSPAHRAALQKLCAQYGVPFHDDNIILMTEDSSSSTEGYIWKRIKPVFSRFLTDDTIKNAQKSVIIGPNSDRKYYGPGTEIGPTLAAMTVRGYIDSLIKAGAGEIVRILDHVTVVARRLSSDSTEARLILNETNQFRIWPGKPKESPHRWLDTTHAHYAAMQFPNTAMTDDWAHSLIHGTRGQIEKKLFEFAKERSSAKQSPSFKSAAEIHTPKSFRPRIMGEVIPRLKAFSHMKGKAQASKNQSADIAGYLAPIDLSANFKNDCDAFIFPGKLPKNSLPALQKTAFDLFSVDDEKILEAPSMNKPVIAIDDGSYTPIIKIRTYLIDAGMGKDIDRVPEYEAGGYPILNPKAGNIDGVMHKGFGLLDIVQSENPGQPVSYARLENAANQILQRRKQEYKPYVGVPIPLKHGPSATNEPYRDDIFKVAVFTSAGNDNRILLEHNAAIGRDIAQMHAGLVWGAGDRHAMGAVYDGYRLAKGEWIEGYSTAPILVMETKRGGMPECHYSEMTADIFERMAKMIKASDVITITPGGFGTVQEMMACFILMRERPDLMKDKKVILHNPILNGDMPFWNPVIETFLGKHALQKLQNDPHALAKQGIFMTTTVAEHKTVITALKNEWQQRRNPTPTPHRRAKQRTLAA